MLTVAELIRYRMAHERYVTRLGETTLPTEHGVFRMIAYQSEIDTQSHLALVLGNPEDGAAPALVRMHSHCPAGDIFGATTCGCAANIRLSLDRIAAEGRGVLVYLRQNASGFSVRNVAGKGSLLFHAG